MSFSIALGRRLKSMRRAAKLSQRAMAELVEADVSTLRRVERGRQLPRAKMVDRWQEITKTTVIAEDMAA
jgi:transcriptional regulator with XRE-family HTH domain